MGGVILVFLVAIAVVILVTPALRTRGRRERDQAAKTAHETVISRLEDHRKRKNQPADRDR
jgi:type II secretory pathway pseudopilin PulG